MVSLGVGRGGSVAQSFQEGEQQALQGRLSRQQMQTAAAEEARRSQLFQDTQADRSQRLAGYAGLAAGTGGDLGDFGVGFDIGGMFEGAAPAVGPQTQALGAPQGAGQPAQMPTASVAPRQQGTALTQRLEPIWAQFEQQAGLPQGYFRRLAEVESGLNPGAENPNSSAAGLFQFLRGTAAEYGVQDPLDPMQATEGAFRYTMRSLQMLRGALGREPTPGELYLAHQQGAAGAVRLLRSPEALASQLVGRDAVRLNGGNPDTMTAGEFANLWVGKFEGGSSSGRQASGRMFVQPASPHLGGLGGSPSWDATGRRMAFDAPPPGLTLGSPSPHLEGFRDSSPWDATGRRMGLDTGTAAPTGEPEPDYEDVLRGAELLGIPPYVPGEFYFGAPAEAERAEAARAALQQSLADPALRPEERRALEIQSRALDAAVRSGSGVVDAITDALALANRLGTRAIEYGVGVPLSAVSPSAGAAVFDFVRQADEGSDALALMGQAPAAAPVAPAAPAAGLQVPAEMQPTEDTVRPRPRPVPTIEEFDAQFPGQETGATQSFAGLATPGALTQDLGEGASASTVSPSMSATTALFTDIPAIAAEREGLQRLLADLQRQVQAGAQLQDTNMIMDARERMRVAELRLRALDRIQAAAVAGTGNFDPLTQALSQMSRQTVQIIPREGNTVDITVDGQVVKQEMPVSQMISMFRQAVDQEYQAQIAAQAAEEAERRKLAYQSQLKILEETSLQQATMNREQANAFFEQELRQAFPQSEFFTEKQTDAASGVETIIVYDRKGNAPPFAFERRENPRAPGRFNLTEVDITSLR